MAIHIARNFLSKDFVHRNGMGSWTDNRHFPFQDIDQLWQLIQTAPSKKRTDPGHPSVVFLRLQDIRVFVQHHCSEFIAIKRYTSFTMPKLLEEDGAL